MGFDKQRKEKEMGPHIYIEQRPAFQSGAVDRHRHLNFKG